MPVMAQFQKQSTPQACKEFSFWKTFCNVLKFIHLIINALKIILENFVTG
jgi:hypothetical protein